MGRSDYPGCVSYGPNDNRTIMGGDLSAPTAALQHHEVNSLIYCTWCGKEDESFIFHVCPNGATFSDRVKWGIDGKIPPYFHSRGVGKYLEPEKLDLTEEDKIWLRRLHIGWE